MPSPSAPSATSAPAQRGLHDQGLALASTRRPTPRADRSCTVLTRWARHLHPRSDHDAFDLVNGHRVRRPVVELRRLRRRDAPAILAGRAQVARCRRRERPRPVREPDRRGREDVRLDAAVGGGSAGSGPPGGLRSRTWDELAPADPVGARLGRDGCSGGETPAASRRSKASARSPPELSSGLGRRDRMLADAPSAPGWATAERIAATHTGSSARPVSRLPAGSTLWKSAARGGG